MGFSLGLAVLVCAGFWPMQDRRAAVSSQTVLAQATEAAQPPSPKSKDQAIPAPPTPEPPLPPALPRGGGAGGRQAPAQKAPAKSAPAQKTPARTAPAQKPAAARSAPDSSQQQIEFDRNGLITMHTNELDVRQLLELISRRSGMNILISPRVSGTITANFEGVTLQELFRSILKLANLVEKTEGSIHYVYTREELKDEAEVKMKERIVTKVYRLNYVRSDELLSVIRPFLSPDVGQRRISITPTYRFGISESNTFGTSGGMTSGGGGAAGGAGAMGPAGVAGSGGAAAGGGVGYQPPTGANSNAESDTLVVQDYESNIKIIDQIIQRVDVRPVQVLIEAVIISIELDKTQQLGVNFALVDNLAQQLGTIGSGAVLNGNVGFTPAQVLTAAGKIAASVNPDPTGAGNGFASPTNGIKYGFISNNITGFVAALETLGSTKILASPRILVLNKQRAEIQLGARLGFQTLSQNFTSTIQQVQFLNVGTLLRLRPFVSSDGMVRMEIHPERSQGVVENNLPSAQTAELTTNVMVPDGATIVIGGLMEDEDDYNQQGLPGISRVPVLGALFGAKIKTDNRRELVVLLTPHIWAPPEPPPPHMALRTPTESMTVSAPPAAMAPPPPPPTTTAARETKVDPQVVRTASPGDSLPPPAALPPVATAAPAPPQVPASPALPQRSVQGSRAHTVRPGESFRSIAQFYYGSERYAQPLWWANRGTVPRSEDLAAGALILIPPAAQLDTRAQPAPRPKPRLLGRIRQRISSGAE
jgi:type IV pilus secretin PilQ/predicted competence protein